MQGYDCREPLPDILRANAWQSISRAECAPANRSVTSLNRNVGIRQCLRQASPFRAWMSRAGVAFDFEESVMNRTRLLMIGFVALVLGAMVSFAVYRTLKSGTGGDTPPGVDVVIAANDIPVGAKVEDRDVKAGPLSRCRSARRIAST